MTQTPPHPELLFGPNPLIESLGPYIPVSNLPNALLREPLKGVAWQELSPEYRIPLIQKLDEHFFPTPLSVDIAASIQKALRASLVKRNPISPEEKRRINQFALLSADGKDYLPRLQPLICTASGGIIAAETGIGKTTIVTRALETFAPDQMVIHGPSEVCGWSRFTQVNYLRLGLPSNSSRGGLLSNIVEALDSLVGSDYMASFRRCRNLDQGIVLVFKMLSIHRVAMLVLDEGQPDNLEECEWQRPFVLFFLAMMNLGVPILLCGHPGAFRTLRRAAQLARRFSTIGIFELQRAKNDSSDWWSTAFAKGIMRFNLCDKISDELEMLNMTREISAGVPGFLTLLWSEAQSIALGRGGKTATISPADLGAAAASSGLKDVRKIVEWLNGKADLGSDYTDLTSPSAKTPSNSADPCAHRAETANTRAANEGRDAAKVIDKIRQKESKTSKKKADKSAKDKKLLENLSLEDLRHSNSILDIAAGLDTLQSDMFDAEQT